MARGAAGGTACGQQDDGHDVGETAQPVDILGHDRPAEAGVFHVSANEALRWWLRFRYHPAPEAGFRPSPSEPRLEGVANWRMASGCPFCFVCSDWRNSRNLNLTEVASHTV